MLAGMNASLARLRPEDLAPGDQRCADFDWSELTLEVIDGPDHAGFDEAYARLDREFGEKGELETRAVLEGRLRRDPALAVAGGLHLAYEILLVRRNGRLVAVRDHSVVVAAQGATSAAADKDERSPGPDGADASPDAVDSPAPLDGDDALVVVHLSHVLVEPELRRTGLAGWLRALPVGFARRCAQAAGSLAENIVLVAEMEPFDPTDEASLSRLGAYERAGFRKLDPAALAYCQPDFRPHDLVRATGPRPVRLDLVLRRIGRETETTFPATEAARTIGALYGMYAADLEREHIEALAAEAEERCSRGIAFDLIAPTS